MALSKKKPVAAAEPATETAVEKPAAEKKTAPKKDAPAKSLLKKTAAKKEAPKKSAEKIEEIYLQSGGTEWNIADCKARAVAAFVAEGHRESSVKKLVIYLKPEEGKAYYVINDGVNGSVDL